MQRAGGRRGVGPHQPAGAQQDAAEIPRDHNNYIGHTGVVDGFQHRGACGLGGFAVIGIAGAAILQHIGIDVVARRAVGGAHTVQHRQRSFLGIGKGSRGDEAAALFLIFKGGCTAQGLVVSHSKTSLHSKKYPG